MRDRQVSFACYAFCVLKRGNTRMAATSKTPNWQNKLRTKQEQFRKSFWQTIYTGKSRPAFLVGCGRSGTSMLIWQLDKSWQIRLYNENHPAAFDNFRLRDFSVVENLIKTSRAPLTLFKPILDTNMTPNLMAHFPDSKVLFAFRHYDDVINSSLKKFGADNRIGHVRRWMADDFAELAAAPPPETTKAFIRARYSPDLTQEEGAALFWLFYNRLYYDMNLHGNGRVHLIRYETLVAEPRREFEALVRFLGLQFEERMVEGVFASSVKRDKSPALRDSIRQDCEDLYQQLSNSLVR